MLLHVPYLSACSSPLASPLLSGEFDNAGAMMSVDETLMCSFQILKPAEKKAPGTQAKIQGK
jgi:hypothetical protein